LAKEVFSHFDFRQHAKRRQETSPLAIELGGYIFLE